MELFDFITPEEMEDLPEDNEAAFVQLVRIAKIRFAERMRELPDTDAHEEIEEARYGFQNVVLGAAKQFDIPALSNFSIPPIENYTPQNYRQFRHDLTHYLTQIMLTAGRRARNDSVPLGVKTTDTVRAHIAHLRDAIENDQKLTRTKRDRLYALLDDLEKELTRNRIRLWAVARVVYELLALPGMACDSYHAITQFTTAVMRDLGEAKIVENESRVVTHDQKLALTPPREQKPDAPASFDQQTLDDEIPF
ncbi:MAG TPA: hypothetical protein VGK90_11555 [Rhizomicrobium sp.]|jgi:hypothetical protein